MNPRKLIIIISQLALLALINRAEYMLAHQLSLRLPGNLVGMLILFAVPSGRLVRLEWIEEGASILTRHLAFFFIPIVVGLIAFKEVFLQNGLAILGTLILSATAGILLCGFIAQAFKEKEAKYHEITAGVIGVTALAYALSRVVGKHYPSPLTSPVFLSTPLVIAVVLLTGKQSGKPSARPAS